MVFQTKTYASLVLALPKSISDKRAAKKRKSLTKIVFSDVGTTFRHTFPCGELQCLSRGDPRDLCINTKIRLLTTHDYSFIDFNRSQKVPRKLTREVLGCN